MDMLKIKQDNNLTTVNFNDFLKCVNIVNNYYV